MYKKTTVRLIDVCYELAELIAHYEALAVRDSAYSHCIAALQTARDRIDALNKGGDPPTHASQITQHLAIRPNDRKMGACPNR